MRPVLGYFITILSLAAFIVILCFVLIPKKDTSGYFLSPLPDFLTVSINKQATLLDLWSPFIDSLSYSGKSLPNYTAKSVLLYDLTTDKTLYGHNTNLHLPMASLTKIMTAIIAYENKDPYDIYTVTQENLVGEDSMGLGAGEQLRFMDLLYGLMLPSGNDAAEVLASNFPSGRMSFINAMNDKAKALGLTNTRFSNPSGLQGDGVQYSSASDLLVITKYALDTIPEFKQVVSTYEFTIPATPTHKAYTLFNETNLLTSYPGVKGVKTGYTPEAGMCLITLLEYKDHKIIGVILNSENRREEMKQFLDYSLNQLGITPPSHQ